jgi:hypothetical protein
MKWRFAGRSIAPNLKLAAVELIGQATGLA